MEWKNIVIVVRVSRGSKHSTYRMKTAHGIFGMLSCVTDDGFDSAVYMYNDIIK